MQNAAGEVAARGGAFHNFPVPFRPEHGALGKLEGPAPSLLSSEAAGCQLSPVKRPYRRSWVQYLCFRFLTNRDSYTCLTDSQRTTNYCDFPYSTWLASGCALDSAISKIIPRAVSSSDQQRRYLASAFSSASGSGISIVPMRSCSGSRTANLSHTACAGA